MVGLARFAASDAGRFYARTHTHYGTDPGAGMPDVLAYNLRAALYVVEAREAKTKAAASPGASPLDKARGMDEWVKSHGG